MLVKQGKNLIEVEVVRKRRRTTGEKSIPPASHAVAQQPGPEDTTQQKAGTNSTIAPTENTPSKTLWGDLTGLFEEAARQTQDDVL